jgi:adenosylcobinamide-phosphate synthase
MYLSYWQRVPFDLLIACGLALLLDFCVGDPQWFPHPVRGIGWLVTKLENRLYGASHRRLAGCALLVLTVSITCACAFLVLWIAGSIGRYVQLAAAAALIWATISVRDLFDHAEQVRLALQQGDLAKARWKLSQMVSRDTANLQEHEVARGCIESVAENLVDGIISPLFFTLLGGPVLAYAFKATSTLDSMVGYRNERYREFGWASARTDDVLNFVPARLMFLTLPLAAAVVGDNALQCVKTMFRDGDKSPSPNSGIPEAGFAGALGIQLGGASTYAGAVIVKPCLNEGAREATSNHIRRAQILLYAASVANFCLLAIVLWLVHYLWRGPR